MKNVAQHIKCDVHSCEYCNCDNDVCEMSKILNELIKRKKEFPYWKMKEVLTKEGITLNEFNSRVGFYNEIINLPELSEIKDKIKINTVFDFTNSQLENFRKNIPYFSIIKSDCPQAWKLEKRGGCVCLLKLVKNAKMPPDVFRELVQVGIFPNVRDLFVLSEILDDDRLSEIQKEKIKFIKDLKNTKKLSFLFEAGNARKLDEHSIIKILTAKCKPTVFELR